MKNIRILAAALLALLLAAGCMAGHAEPAEIIEESPLETYVPGGSWDNDACFDNYVAMLFGIKPTTRVESQPKRMPQTLTGNDKIYFDVLSSEIVKIAAGERSSTVITVPVSLFGADGSYSAADLGVEAIVANGAITDEARQAMYDMISFNLTRIHTFLRGSYPYHLYWYDKTRGVQYRLPTFRAESRNGEWKIFFSNEVSFNFAVSDDYSAGEYTVDTSRAGTVNEAVARAHAIVRECAGKSDYEKLLAYKNKICDLTSYNYGALDDDAASYGDNRQLVWVFDTDPDTKVVCEGYSKAFQYLCDCSTFNGDVNCICVAGATTGNHMWNIVRMPNGKNYLVDVTNCDSVNAVPPSDRLFLVGYFSGTPEAGYVIRFDSREATYTYNSVNLSQYPISMLTLSDKKYLDEAAGDVPPAEYTTLILPADLQSIGDYAFAGISAQAVVIPDGCQSIGDHAFANCGNLDRVVIPDSVTTIHDDAFAGCHNLTIASDSLRVMNWAAAHGYIAVVE